MKPYCGACDNECIVVTHIEYETSEFWGMNQTHALEYENSDCCNADVMCIEEETE